MSSTPAVSRSLIFGPALAAPLGGWAYAGRPLQVTGLALMALAGLCVIPVVMTTVVLFTSELPVFLVPRPCRAWYRNRTDRHGYKKRARGEQKSSVISHRLRHLVYAADRYRCVGCRIREGQWDERVAHYAVMNLDHRIPWAWGGPTIVSNGYTLCSYCNIAKCDYWVDWRRRPHWSRHFDQRNLIMAHRIFRKEGFLRYWPPRVWRLAWYMSAA